MNRVKYYQLTERAQSCDSIGVIKQDGDDYPIHKIKEALEAHFDEEVTDIEVEYFNSTGNIEVSFECNGFRETVDGTQTWLYF